MDTRIYHPVSPATVTEEAGTRGGTHMGRGRHIGLCFGRLVNAPGRRGYRSTELPRSDCRREFLGYRVLASKDSVTAIELT